MILLIVIYQIDQSLLSNTTNVKNMQFIPDDDRDAGGLPASLTLCTATRVMLIRNIATDYGMVNGILGFVTQVESDKNIPIRIYVRFDDETVGQIFKKKDFDAIPIEKIEQEYHYKGQSIIRTQFPFTQSTRNIL